jgi:hypothetical protein
MVTKRCVLVVLTRTGWNIPGPKSTMKCGPDAAEAQRMESAESSLEATKEVLHRVAAHVLARRRVDVSGRFGLRVIAVGISTPMFGHPAETA